MDPLHAALACPACGGALDLPPGAGAAPPRCLSCKGEFAWAPSGVPDLRLRGPKRVSLDVELRDDPPDPDRISGAFPANELPEVDFSGQAVPWHLSRELLTWIPRARSPESIALDLGCGGAVHRGVLERAGHRYLGLDHASEKATLLADAQALPLRDASVDFVLSIAVLEHVRLPLVALRELNRVLKPGGFFVGSVAFLEPFHGDSYYHHSHLGTWSALRVGGFTVVRLGASAGWTGLVAQSSMVLFPRLPEPLARLLVLPLALLHRLWWWGGRLVAPEASERARLLHNAGAIYFVAKK